MKVLMLILYAISIVVSLEGQISKTQAGQTMLQLLGRQGFRLLNWRAAADTRIEMGTISRAITKYALLGLGIYIAAALLFSGKPPPLLVLAGGTTFLLASSFAAAMEPKSLFKEVISSFFFVVVLLFFALTLGWLTGDAYTFLGPIAKILNELGYSNISPLLLTLFGVLIVGLSFAILAIFTTIVLGFFPVLLWLILWSSTAASRIALPNKSALYNFMLFYFYIYTIYLAYISVFPSG